MTKSVKISMVSVLKAMGKDKQISQYLAKRFKEIPQGVDEKDFKEYYMVEVSEVEKFLNQQVIGKLSYKEEAQKMLDSKEYLGFTLQVSIKSTSKKANAEKKGTIKNLRKFLELKGLQEEFQEMLNSGVLEEEELGE